MKQKLFIIAILVLTTNLIFSQSTKKDSIQLSDIVVTGSKTEISRKIVPLSVSQISKQEIENTGQMNILPALNNFVPGVFVTERNILGFGVSTGGSGSISIRGVSGSPNTDVLILIDGHPQYQGLFGHPLSDAYVASDVEKVEVIRGPASLLYGTNAMAGAINIITKKQNEESFKMTMGAAYGSFNTQKFYETIGYKKNKFSIFTSFNHDQTNGIRTKTDFNISNGYTKVGYELSNHYMLSADFSIAGFKGNDNGSIYAPTPFGIDITRGESSVSIDDKYEKTEGSVKLYHNFGEHTLSNGFHSTDRNSGLMLYQTIKLFEGNNLTVGTDIAQYGGISNQGVLHDSLLTANDVSVYAYMQQNLFKNLTLSGGLRFQNNSIFGNELIPLVGLTYNPSTRTTFKASVSKGFRNPTIMEMYLFFPIPSIQNPDLRSERLINYEISWIQSIFENKLNIEFTVFKMNASNIIEVSGTPQTLQRKNSGTFTNQGIEFSARYAVCKNLFLHVNYSYLDLSKVVLAAPRQQVNISANYSYKIWNLNVSTQYIEKLYTFIHVKPIDPPTTIQSDYLPLNARLSVKPLKKLEVFVDGNNLLNQKYQINYGYPMPGINFNAGFNVRF